LELYLMYIKAWDNLGFYTLVRFQQRRQLGFEDFGACQRNYVLPTYA
jgi:hypothetical protein